MSDNESRLESLLAAAVEIEDNGQREAYLQRACEGDAAQLAELQSMVHDYFAAGSLIDRPAAGMATIIDPRPTSNAQTRDAPGQQIGPYKLREMLGEGGMGTVFIAQQDTPVRRKVALKLIKLGMDSREVLARFEAERQALAVMDHPNIARVLDAGLSDSGRPYFVMEIVKGLPITDHCDVQRLGSRERLGLFIQLCRAIQHAHQKGIIHRDLKPSNVLVAMHDTIPVVKVIDFGVAKAIGQPLTENSLYTGLGQMVGTPLYMSPEQAGQSSVDVDTRSDVYSLGVLLYELLTGCTPFEKETLKQAGYEEMRRIIQEVDPPRPSTRFSTLNAAASSTIAMCRQSEPRKLSKQLRGELDWIVMKALEKDRTRRYESASAFAADVERYLKDEPVEACPPSTRYRLAKFFRRNKAPMVAAGVVLTVLVVGIIGTALGWVRARKAEGITQQHFEEAEAALARAEKAEADTLEAYRASTDEAIEQLIGSKEQLGPQEKTYLENTLKRWQAFAARQGADERSQAIRGEGHHRIANLLAKLGRIEEARAEYQTAHDLQKKLVAQFPAVPQYQQNLAEIHNYMGILLLGLGKREEARAEFLAARDLQQKLVEQFPAVPTYQQSLANTHNNMGILLLGLGKREEARAEYLVARDLGKKLVEQFPAVHQYRQQLASTHDNLGIMLAGVGKEEEARAEYLVARDLGKKLVEQFPAVLTYQQRLAATHNNMAGLLANLGKEEEARAEFLAARDLQQKLVEQFPAVPTYQQSLANTHSNIARVLTDLGKEEEARAEFLAARDLQQKLVEQFPAVPEYQQDLANTHNNMGVLLFRIGKWEEARADHLAARDLQKKLMEEFPTVPAYQIDLAGSYCNYGDTICEEGKPAESLEWFDLAIRTLKPVHDQEPGDVTAMQFLRNSHWNRAEAYDRLQKPAEAVDDWNRAIDLTPLADQPGLRVVRALSQFKAGMIAEAVAEVAELTKDSNWDDRHYRHWYNFACVYAVASGKIPDKKQEYADRAMELLQQAVNAGWTNAAHMAKDTDLDPLRDRDDFRKLCDSLSEPEPKDP